VSAAKHFLRQTAKLDALRNEDTFEIIPELKSVKVALNVEK
jgi:hypothetical protein